MWASNQIASEIGCMAHTNRSTNNTTRRCSVTEFLHLAFCVGGCNELRDYDSDSSRNIDWSSTTDKHSGPLSFRKKKHRSYCIRYFTLHRIFFLRMRASRMKEDPHVSHAASSLWLSWQNTQMKMSVNVVLVTVKTVANDFLITLILFSYAFLTPIFFPSEAIIRRHLESATC